MTYLINSSICKSVALGTLITFSAASVRAETAAIDPISALSDPKQAAIEYALGTTLSTMNETANSAAHSLFGDNLTFLDLSLGLEDGKLSLQGTSVYRIYENKNIFIFNQSSLVEYDGRETLNLGFSIRHISDDDTVIIGANAFHDYEFGSNHRRIGIGSEVLTSILQVRANYYKALTGEISYNDQTEAALDGHDIKISYELPFFYSSSLFYKNSVWTDGGSYEDKVSEFGASAEIAPNLMLNVSSKDSSRTGSDMSASVAYSIVFGEKQANRSVRDGVFKFKLEPIRHMLYQPVQRENRIMKKTTRLGVTVSGY